MYTLHKLKAAQKRRAPESIAQGSTYDDTHTALHEASEPVTFDPTTTGNRYPWGFDEKDIERFPALKRRNFWCMQRHQARGQAHPLLPGLCSVGAVLMLADSASL